MNRTLIKVLILSTILFSAFSYLPKIARDANTFKFGVEPKNFCDFLDFQDIPIKKDTIINRGSAKINWANNGVDPANIVLTTGEYNMYWAGAIWMNNAYTWDNGFVTEFNMQFSDLTCSFKTIQECVVGFSLFSWNPCLWHKDVQVEDWCGADGIAFVLQTQGTNAVGVSGAGLGYAELFNVLAVEFDAFSNYYTHGDPNPDKHRHISAILKKGKADANEANSFAWNDSPFNFKSNRDSYNYKEGYIDNPKVKIEYFNKMLKVYLNDALQLAYYYEIDLKTEFGITTSQFYMGITGSTGYVGQKQTISNWSLKRVIPTASSSFAALLANNKEVEAGIQFEVGVFLKNKCGGLYEKHELDLESMVKVNWLSIPTNECRLISVTSKVAASALFPNYGNSVFVALISCDKRGSKIFRITYNGKEIPVDVGVEVKAGAFASAKVEMVANSGSVDNKFKLKLTALDSNGNVAAFTNPDDLKNRIPILWPNPTDTNSALYTVTYDSSVKYSEFFTYELSPNRVGLFKLSPSSLLTQYHPQGVTFDIKSGAVSLKTTTCRVLKSDLTDFTDVNVSAGQAGILVVTLRDQFSNPSPLLQDSVANFGASVTVKSLAETLTDQSPKVTELYFNFKFSRQGENLVKATYKGSEITCTRCLFSVIPGPAVFSNSDLLSYLTSTMSFGAITSDRFLFKTDTFQFLFVLRDSSNNQQPSIKIGDYSATLSGNNMKTLTLQLTSFQNGALMRLQPEDASNYNLLVGAKGYQITVKEIASGNEKSFPLQLLSDGSDADAGNGDQDPSKMKVYFTPGLLKPEVEAGKVYQAVLELRTSQNLRCNYWADVVSKVDPASDRTVVNLKRDNKPGVYTISLYFEKAGAYTVSFLLAGSLTAANSILSFTVLPGAAISAKVEASYLVQGKTDAIIAGNAEEQKNIQVEYFDTYLNPNDPVNTDLIVTLPNGLFGTTDLVIPLKCLKLKLGSQICNFVTMVKGDYILSSKSFISEIKQYKLTIYMGAPNVKYSEANIDISTIQNMKAGNSIMFKIIPRDSSGAPLDHDSSLNHIAKWSLTIDIPKTGLISQKLSAGDVSSDGSIKISVPVLTTGSVKFYPKVTPGVDVMCDICTIAVEAGDISFDNSKVYSVEAGSMRLLNINDPLALDNTNKIPILFLEFYDLLGNQNKNNIIYKKFQGKLTCITDTTSIYEFSPILFNGGIQWEMKQDSFKIYQTALKTDPKTCKLVLEASKDGGNFDSQISFNDVKLEGKAGDEMFTDADISDTVSRVVPSTISISAGQTVTVTVELKSAQGKYYKSDSVLTLSTSNNNLVRTINKGPLAGTYLVTLSSEKSDDNTEITFQADYTINTVKKTLPLKNKLILKIKPLDVSSLMVKNWNTAGVTCTSGDVYGLVVDGFDKYKNPVTSMNKLDNVYIQILFQGSSVAPNLAITTDTPPKLRIESACTKVGDLVYRIMGDDSKINEYKVKVIPGVVNPSNSLSSVDSTDIVAGNSVKFSVIPRDAASNPLDLSVDLAKNFKLNHKNPDGSSFILDFSYILGENSLSVSKILLTSSGVHEFAAFYSTASNKEFIPSNNFITNVKESVAVYKASAVELFAPEKNAFAFNINGYTIDMSSKPTFRISLKDGFNNPVTAVPADWNLELRLRHPADEKEINTIYFCYDVIDKQVFTICETNKTKWDTLKNGDNYLLILKNNEITLNNGYTVKLLGSTADPQVDINGVLNVDNTVISPQTPMTLRAGESFSYIVELRTSDKNMRVSSWLNTESITLQFSAGSEKDTLYKVTKGDKVGRYILTVTPTKVLGTGLITLTVVVDKTQYTGFKITLNVKPADVNKVYVVNQADSSKEIRADATLTSSTVDKTYSLSFRAFDIYDNNVPLSQSVPVNLKLVESATGKEGLYTDISIVGTGLYSIQFQPKVTGEFVVSLDKGFNYKIQITQGDISIDNSLGGIVDYKSSVDAGTIISVTITPKDQWGNLLIISDDQISKLENFKAFFKVGTSEFVVNITPGTLSADKKQVTFTTTLKIKGQYTFGTSYNGQDLKMAYSKVSVSAKPDYVLLMSTLYYFDTMSFRFLEMDKKTPLQENNLFKTPVYRLILSDEFGNILDSIPSTLKTSLDTVTLELKGDTFVGTVAYKPSLDGNGILFNQNPDDILKYRAKATSNPTLSLKIGTQSLDHSIILLGENDSGLFDCSADGPDSKMTWITSKSLKAKAGEIASFSFEIRCSNGRRFAQATLDKITISSTPSETKFKTDIKQGDATGRFFVYVGGEVAGLKTLKIQYDQKVLMDNIELNVDPADLKSVELSDLSSVKADTDFFFEVTAKDAYNNVKNVEPSDINLQIKFPTGGIRSYTVNKDSVTKKIIYTVLAKKAGEYSISSPTDILGGKEQKFTITAGEVSPLYTTVEVKVSDNFAVGQSAAVTVNLFDSFGNPTLDPTQLIKLSVNGAVFKSTAAGNTLVASYSSKVAGPVKIIGRLGFGELCCKGCNINFAPGPINLQNSRLFNGEKEVFSSLDIASGSKELSLVVKIYDDYNNNLQVTDYSGKLTVVLSGNSMTPMNLQAVFQANILTITLSEEQKVDFSNLVPANAYILDLVYSELDKEKGRRSFSINLTGTSGNDADPAGNGFPNPDKSTFVNLSTGTITMKAGEDYPLTVKLLNNDGKRVNIEYKVSDVVVIVEPKDALTVSYISGEKRGLYGIVLKSFKAQKGVIKVNVRGSLVVTLERQIEVQHNSPDLSKTVIVESLPAQTQSDTQQKIKFSLSDTYGNPINDVNIAKLIVGKASKGNATISETSMIDSNTFLVTVTVTYPPKNVNFFIYYNNTKDNTLVPINKDPISTEVITKINVENTEILGEDIAGITTDKSMSFMILIKDDRGYCFETTKKVSVKVHGPYTEKGAKEVDTTAIKSIDATAQDIAPFERVGYGCMKYYKVLIDSKDGIFKKVGYYQIDVSVDGESTIKRFRETLITPGVTDPTRSVIDFPTMQGFGNSPYVLKAGSSFVFHILTYDKFDNPILENRNTTDTLNGLLIPGLKEVEEYNISTPRYLGNGTFLVEVMVVKVGDISNINMTINGHRLSWSEIEKRNAPMKLRIHPNECSSLKPNVIYQHLQKTPPISGLKARFFINCLDKYGNPVEGGGENFDVSIMSSTLALVGTDRLIPNIMDLKNGTYEISFVVAWEGEYTASIIRENLPYGDTFTFKALNSQCSLDATKPYLCVTGKSKGSCVASYKECGYDYLQTCTDPAKPISCKVNKVTTCVKGRYLCDCPESYTRCPSDGKCVESPAFCSDIQERLCSQDFPILCPSGVCRTTLEDCPSQVVCPPGYQMCLDQSCVSVDDACPGEGVSCPMNENWDYYYKCDDQTCSPGPLSCPTAKTCPLPSQVVCPDRTCVANELECKMTPKCDEGFVLCQDQSCKPKPDNPTKPLKQNCPRYQTCHDGFALCNDGSCRRTCSLLSPSDSSSTNQRRLHTLYRLMEENTVLTQVAKDSEINNCKKNQFKCPGGECVDSYYLCSSLETCPANSVKCPDQSCASSTKECVASQCEKGKALCWDGTCSDSISLCPTRSSCPDTQPVKCSDGSCVKSANDCPELVPCPAYVPFKCANGECRENEKNCPTYITCPPELPVLCPDSSCKKAKYHCSEANELIKCPDSMILCSNGNCAKSKALCPTSPSCNKNEIRCWDNTCVTAISECPKIQKENNGVCPSDLPLHCPDGSCRKSLEDCPTEIICPEDRPIKCDDGTCKSERSKCYPSSQCDYGLRRCPDGSCTSKECGTPITCSKNAPYKCYDSTCKKDPKDCPEAPSCTEKSPILCPDGSCVAQRIFCSTISKCPNSKPVKCPDNNCYASVNECKTIDGCPAGRVLCEDGSCATISALCPPARCPNHLRFQCKDGFCVSDLKFCDDETTGCPYNRAFKCQNGQCVPTENDCPNNNTFKCTEGYTLCEDGSCAISKEKCYNKMGCPEDLPFRCANGMCINPSTVSCPVANCPKTAPIKCLNGLCTKSLSQCPSFLSLEDYSQCSSEPSGNIVPCADGRCVASSEQCRPLFECQEGYIRCDDGSCRISKNLCPNSPSTCPKSKSYRCQTGLCASTQLDCILSNGCPINAPEKCEKTGICQPNQEACKKQYALNLLPNGCSADKPYKCSYTDSCLSTASECKPSNGCPKGFIQCVDKSCAADKAACLKVKIGCSANQIACADGSCQKSIELCNAKNGCPMTKPLKCSDGKTCVDSYLTATGERNCPSEIKCTSYKPYLCADGECQGDPSLCRVQVPCPANAPFKCSDGQCRLNKAACPNQGDLCPITAYIKCLNGACVQKAVECGEAYSCPSDRPILCSSGECVLSQNLCVSEKSRNGASQRLLQTSGGEIIDPDCSTEAPNRCSDGRCTKGMCPIFEGCHTPSKPYMCQSGLCAESQEECGDENIKPCQSNSLLRCPDGYCRATCERMNSCPLEKPFHCSNGLCGKSEADCAADSNCRLDNPFRCADNTCVVHQSLCSRPLSTYQVNTVTATVSPFTTTEIELNSFGKLIIPGGALLSPVINGTALKRILEDDSTPKFNGITVSPVSLDSIRNYSTYVDTSRLDSVLKTFPLDYDGKLAHHQTVRSSIAKIESLNRENKSEVFRFPLIFEVAADLMIATNKTSDYCLGKLNSSNQIWNCSSRVLLQASNSYSNNTFAYPVESDGIYAVIYNPEPNVGQKGPEVCDYFCQYKSQILWSIFGVFVFLIVAFFLLWRVSRYIGKYHEAKKQMENFREQINEMQNTTTTQQGQTIRDKIEGITFVQNPAFQKADKAEVSKVEEMEAAIVRISKREKLLESAMKELTEKNIILEEDNEILKRELIIQSQKEEQYQRDEKPGLQEFD